MVLVLQTNVSGRISIWFVENNTIQLRRQRRVRWHGSEKLLSMIVALLGRHYFLRRLKSIVVVNGPGPFTAVRSGIIVANTLGWLLQVPVSALHSEQLLTDKAVLGQARKSKQKQFRLVRPSYGRAPNITVAKKKF